MLTSAVSKVQQKEVVRISHQKMGNWNTEQCVKCCLKLRAKMIIALFSGGYGIDSVKK